MLISWTTASEIDTIGFRVLRETPRGREKTVDAISQLIPSAGYSLLGSSYNFLDNSKGAVSAEHYYLEDVDLYGKVTRFGPITVDRGKPGHESRDRKGSQ